MSDPSEGGEHFERVEPTVVEGALIEAIQIVDSDERVAEIVEAALVPSDRALTRATIELRTLGYTDCERIRVMLLACSRMIGELVHSLEDFEEQEEAELHMQAEEGEDLVE